MTSVGNITRPYFERMTKAGPKVEPITTEQGGRRKAPTKVRKREIRNQHR